MADTDLLVHILQACAQTAPGPLFPADLAAAAGIDRAQLDDAIDRLRNNGYIQIADWVQGKGQGYTLTAAGAEALTTPTELRQPAAAPEPVPMPKRSHTPSTWERGEIIRTALLEPRPPIVTMVILFANLLVFAIGISMALMRGISLEVFLLGKVPGDLAELRGLAELRQQLGVLSTGHVIFLNEWWRLVTHQFLHSGLLHLGL